MFDHETEDTLQYVTDVVYDPYCNSSRGVELQRDTCAIRNHHGTKSFAKSRQSIREENENKPKT